MNRRNILRAVAIVPALACLLIAASTVQAQGPTTPATMTGPTVTPSSYQAPYGDRWTVEWTYLGHALAGTFGEPVLQGSLGVQGALEFDLHTAMPQAAAVMFIGVDDINIPFKGGIIVPNVWLGLGFQHMYVTSQSGDIHLDAYWPDSMPNPITVYFQFLIIDDGAPLGVAFSNALRLDASKAATAAPTNIAQPRR